MVKIITFIALFIFLVALCCALMGAGVMEVLVSCVFLVPFCALRR